MSSLGVADTVLLTLMVFGRSEDLMCNAEAHLAFPECWLIILGAGTMLFIPEGYRTLYTKVGFSIC